MGLLYLWCLIAMLLSFKDHILLDSVLELLEGQAFYVIL